MEHTVSGVCTGMRLRHLLPSAKVEILLVGPMRHAYEGQSRNQLLLYFHPYVGSRDGAQAAKLVKHIYPLSHVSGLPSTFCLGKALSLAWNLPHRPGYLIYDL